MLASDIRDAKFGYTPFWAYDEDDAETGVKTKKKAREDTFLVSAPEKILNGERGPSSLAGLQFQPRSGVSSSTPTPDIANLLSPTARRRREMADQSTGGHHSQMRSIYSMFVFEAADDHSWSA